ncbi:MAG: polysaccharide deacetylase family protein [Chloroflexota bacterium]
MTPNPTLKKLGFAPDDRVVIFHADDVGMCHSSIAAFEEMIATGPLTSGATMVPCSWFPTVAAYCRENPETDIGVHLTFTSEWDTYRWGPLSTGDPTSGLMDDEGYFYRTTADAQANANPDFIEAEVIAQVERAIQAGITITHIDTHMGTMFHPNFINAYLAAGRKYKMPLLILRMSEERQKRWADNPEMLQAILKSVNEAEEDGFPLVDYLYQMPLREPENRIDDVTKTLDELQPGLTKFIVHPCKDTAEIRHVAPDWRGRVADYQCFIHDEIKDYLAKSKIQIIGYRELKEAMSG